MPALAVVAALAGAVLTFSAVFAAERGPVVTDPQSGLAISGFDPVAYFSEAKPAVGRAELEHGAGGAVWRFTNAGNRAAFAGDPDVYAPRFGGYDPVAIARGASVPGHPEIWLVSGQRLYLFYNASARAAFAAEPERIIETAERNWPVVQKKLP